MARARITLRAQLRDDAIRVEVIDEGSGTVPTIREEAERDGPGGGGLRIVDALSPRWGTFEGTTQVWANIPLAPATPGWPRRAGANRVRIAGAARSAGRGPPARAASAADRAPAAARGRRAAPGPPPPASAQPPRSGPRAARMSAARRSAP